MKSYRNTAKALSSTLSFHIFKEVKPLPKNWICLSQKELQNKVKKIISMFLTH